MTVSATFRWDKADPPFGRFVVPLASIPIWIIFLRLGNEFPLFSTGEDGRRLLRDHHTVQMIPRFGSGWNDGSRTRAVVRGSCTHQSWANKWLKTRQVIPREAMSALVGGTTLATLRSTGDGLQRGCFSKRSSDSSKWSIACTLSRRHSIRTNVIDLSAIACDRQSTCATELLTPTPDLNRSQVTATLHRIGRLSSSNEWWLMTGGEQEYAQTCADRTPLHTTSHNSTLISATLDFTDKNFTSSGLQRSLRSVCSGNSDLWALRVWLCDYWWVRGVHDKQRSVAINGRRADWFRFMSQTYGSQYKHPIRDRIGTKRLGLYWKQSQLSSGWFWSLIWTNERILSETLKQSKTERKNSGIT